MKKRIGIIDADLLDHGTRHPNLVCLKLSGWHKAHGDTVELITDYSDIAMPAKAKAFDHIYLAKVFDYTRVPVDVTKISNLTYGGTGFYFETFSPAGAHMLPEEIEHFMPDYHLYDGYVQKKLDAGEKRVRLKDYLDYSIGFTTRGCFRGCDFCVNHCSTGVKFHAHVSEFLDPTRKYIHLWDDNILGYPKWREVFDELAETGKYFRFRQGMDIRLLTDAKAKVLASAKYHKSYTFAFDRLNEKEYIERGLDTFHRWLPEKIPQLYVLVGFEDGVDDVEGAFERIRILSEHHALPYIMRHKNYQHSKYRGMYINLARWCNQPSFFKKMTYREFCYANGEKSASVRYMLEFEHDYPEIAAKYYDMRWSDLREIV